MMENVEEVNRDVEENSLTTNLVGVHTERIREAFVRQSTVG